MTPDTIEQTMTTTTTKRSSATLNAWIIWSLAALFYAYDCFLQVSPSVMVPNLMHAFHVNAATLGNLSALYFYAYASLQIPAGVVLDTFGPRWLLTGAAAICATGALIFSMAGTLGIAQIGRLLIGMGAAFAVIGTFKLGATWFSLEKFAFITGLTVMTGMLGSVTAGAPLALLVEDVGWRHSMMLLAIIGFCISCLIWFIVRDHPDSIDKYPKNTSKHRARQSSILTSLLFIFKQKQSWLTALYGGLMFGPTSAFAALWGVPFLMTKYGLSRPIAAGAVSMVFVGWVVGSPLWGFISDNIKRRKPTMYLSSLGGLVMMLTIIYLPISLTIIYVILFLFGLFSSGFLPAFSIIREINPPDTNATALGFMNMLNMVGGAALQPLIGWILDRYWAGGMIKHARLYSPHAFHLALATLPLVIFLSLCLIPFIKETYCKPVVNFFDS